MERVKTAITADLPPYLKQPVDVKHRIQAVPLTAREIIPHWTEQRSSLWGPFLRVLSWTALGGGASFAIAWAVKDLYPYVRLVPKRVGVAGGALFFVPAFMANVLRARFDRGTTRIKRTKECKRYAVPKELLEICGKDLNAKKLKPLIDRTWKRGDLPYRNRVTAPNLKHELGGWIVAGEDSYVYDVTVKGDDPARYGDKVLDPDGGGIWASATYYTSLQRVVLSERLNAICKRQDLDGIFVPMMRLLPVEVKNEDVYLKYPTLMERPRVYDAQETVDQLKTLRPEMQRTLARQLCRLIAESGLTKALIRLSKDREHLVVMQCKPIGLFQESGSKVKPRLREECALVGLKNLVLREEMPAVFQQEAQKAINRIRYNPWWQTVRLYRNLRYPPPPPIPLLVGRKKGMTMAGPSTHRTAFGRHLRSLKVIVTKSS